MMLLSKSRQMSLKCADRGYDRATSASKAMAMAMPNGGLRACAALRRPHCPNWPADPHIPSAGFNAY
jgi:hypothetical protein